MDIRIIPCDFSMFIPSIVLRLYSLAVSITPDSSQSTIVYPFLLFIKLPNIKICITSGIIFDYGDKIIPITIPVWSVESI